MELPRLVAPNLFSEIYPIVWPVKSILQHVQWNLVYSQLCARV